LHKLTYSESHLSNMLNQVRCKMRFILEEVILKYNLQMMWEDNTEEP